MSGDEIYRILQGFLEFHGLRSLAMTEPLTSYLEENGMSHDDALYLARSMKYRHEEVVKAINTVLSCQPKEPKP